MAQIILIEPDETLRELLTLNLTTYVGAEIIPKENFAEALTLLQIIPNIDLIIARKVDTQGVNSDEISEFIVNSERETTLILTGTETISEHARAHCVEIAGPMEWEKIIQTAAKILGVTQESLNKKVRPDFVPVRIKLFKYLTGAPCDVFIRIKRGPADYQFVKRLHAGDQFSPAVIAKYIDQGLAHFYVPKDYLANFTNYVSDHFVSALAELNWADKTSFEFLGESYNQALHNAREIGFSSATIQLAEAVMNSMIASVETSEQVGPLLQRVINSPTGLAYQHGHMSAIVALEILKACSLNSKHNLEKVSYAALFKDITLTDREEWMLIDSFEGLENLLLPEGDWDRVFGHALDAAALVQNARDIPLGVDELIRHHHGTTNGKGFSLGQIDQLPEVSLIFVLAVDFVNQLFLFQKEGSASRPVIATLKERFAHSPRATKYLSALNKRLRKKD